MRKYFIIGLFIIFGISTFALKLELEVKEYAGIKRINVPTWGGIPLPQGLITDANLGNLVVLNANSQVIPCGIKSIGYWRDGSVRWVKINFQASVTAKSKTKYYLTLLNNGSAPVQGGLNVSTDDNYITVNTGVLKFNIKKNGVNIINEAWCDMTNAGKFDDAHKIISSGNNSYFGVATDFSNKTGAISTAEILEQNSEEVIIKVTGTFAKGPIADHDGEHVWQMYISAYRGKPYVRMQHHWFYDMNMGFKYLDFKDYNIVIDHNLTGSLSYTMGTKEGDVKKTSSNEVKYWFAQNDSLLIYDNGTQTNYTREGRIENGTKQGWMHISNGTKGIGIGMQYMWQMAPKALINKDGKAIIGMYHHESSFPWYAGSGRTHTMFINFSNDVNNTKEAFYAVSQSLFPKAPPVWNCGITKALGKGLVHLDSTLFRNEDADKTYGIKLYHHTMQKMIPLQVGYSASNASIGLPHHYLSTGQILCKDGFNILNFGDAVEPTNSWCKAGQQHYGNNYYDNPHFMFQSYAQTNDPRYRSVGYSKALQNIDLDINNTDGSCKSCPGVMQFFQYQADACPSYVTGISNVVTSYGNTNHWKVQGVFEAYFITGDPVFYDNAKKFVDIYLMKYRPWVPGQPRASGHALEGLLGAAIATNDPVYENRINDVLMPYIKDEVVNPSGSNYTGNYFQAYIVSEALYFAYDWNPEFTDLKEQILNLNTDIATKAYHDSSTSNSWALAGLSIAIDIDSTNEFIATKANDWFWDFISSSRCVFQARQKILVKYFKATPHYLVHVLEDKNYLDNYPQYAILPSDTIYTSINDESILVEKSNVNLNVSPNPFNPSTTIKINLGSISSNITLKIFNTSGKLVADLSKNIKGKKGTQTISWKATNLASGIYFAELNINSKVKISQKLLLLK